MISSLCILFLLYMNVFTILLQLISTIILQGSIISIALTLVSQKNVTYLLYDVTLPSIGSILSNILVFVIGILYHLKSEFFNSLSNFQKNIKSYLSTSCNKEVEFFPILLSFLSKFDMLFVFLFNVLYFHSIKTVLISV